VSTMIDALANDVVLILEQGLERERRLGQTYRQEMQVAWGARVRKLWEEGWALKRAHEDELGRLLRATGDVPTGVSAAPPPPSRREVLSWLYEQERLLAGRYRDCVPLIPQTDTQHLVQRLAEEQKRLAERLRETYRDYSAA